MDLRERKLIINGATEKLPEYANGTYNGLLADKYRDTQNKWFHAPSAGTMPGMLTTGINFAGSTLNSFGPVKSSGDILQESGTSVGLGSGFSYLKLNAVDAGAQMDELSKQNTANTLNTAASGAALGSAFGPIGAGIGGVVGGVVGLFGGASRKNKMAERIRNAQILAVRNNNFNLASAQTDYLTNQYNVEHDNTQDDLIYSAKDGMVPGFDDGKPNARLSRHEWVIDTKTGEQAQMPGKADKKDTLLVHLKNPKETAVVSNNKLADGIRNSDYYTMTGDLNGALMRDLIYRNMKDYRTVKLLGYGSFNAKNGILPGFDDGTTPKLDPNLLNRPYILRNYTAPLTLKDYTKLTTPSMEAKLPSSTNYLNTTPDKFFGIDLTIDPKLGGVKQQGSSTTRSGNDSDNSNWANAITSGMGILGGLSLILGAHNLKLNKPDTYAPNQFERQALDIYGWLNPATNRAVQAAAATEARNRYNINRMGGLSGAQKYLAAVLSGIGLQNNIASIIADANRERNQYRSQLAGAMMNAGASDAQRRQNANQYLEEAYARSHGARTQMEQMGMQNILAAFNQYYKNLDKLNRFNRTMAYYDQDYQLRRDALNKGWA